MKIVIQRVQSASVAIEDSTVGAIKQGLLLLVGVGPEDTKEDLDYAVRKIINMRIFSDEEGKILFKISSKVPETYREAARKHEFVTEVDSRGFVSNAGPETLIKFINFGSSGGTDRII